MSSPKFFVRIVTAVMAFALCGGPQLVAAQQTTSPGTNQQQQQSAPAAQDQPDQNVGTSDQNATPDPSKGPLKPQESELPNAPSSTQKNTQQSNSTDQNQPKEAPIGVGAAQQGKVTGGAASKPAGTAIAPAKQRQTRSLLIKVGAIAAGAAAVGIIYGLSRSSPSIPPGANTTTTAQTQR